MSCLTGAEKGAIRILAANHTTLSVISRRVNRLPPRSSRNAMAARNGATAVITRRCGLNSSRIVPGNIMENFTFHPHAPVKLSLVIAYGREGTLAGLPCHRLHALG
jgi:hypothetical protein